jgi:hypothetical protein
VRTRKAYQSDLRRELAEIADDYVEAERRLDDFFAAFSAQWHTVNKPFGFEVHCARLGGVKQRLAHCRNRLLAYLSGVIDRIEELQENILPLDPNLPDNFLMNDYRRLVSPSEL